jgi:hypothetical protein
MPIRSFENTRHTGISLPGGLPQEQESRAAGTVRLRTSVPAKPQAVGKKDRDVSGDNRYEKSIRCRLHAKVRAGFEGSSGSVLNSPPNIHL